MTTKTDPKESEQASCAPAAGSAVPPWTASKTEEVISALWTIAGLCAWMAEIRWLAWALLIKATIDTIGAVVLAVVEVRRETKHPQSAGTQRPGTPDGPLATETRKPGSLK